MAQQPKSLARMSTQEQIYEWVNQEVPRKEILARLQESGMTVDSARVFYYNTLKEMSPDSAMLDAYKMSVVQQNLDRLERIVNDCIGGNYQEKTVALKAIDQISKLVGAYNDNQITVARNKEGDEIIQITFYR